MKNLGKLNDLFEEMKIEALLVSNPSNIFYHTGLSQFVHYGDAFLLISGEKKILFTSPLYADGVGVLNDIQLRVINADKPLAMQFYDIVRHEKWRRVGVEGKHISLEMFLHLKKNVDAEMVPTSKVVERLRMIKTNTEFDSIQKASSLTDRTFEYVLGKISSNITEKELAFEIENFIRKNGGELAFPVIAAFGKNASVPHHMSTDRKLSGQDTLVLLDFGAKVNGYCSDLTRCVFVDTPDDFVVSTYDSLLKVQRKTIDFAKRQAKRSPLCELANYCEEQLKKEKLPRMPHSLGHGVGADIHELPLISTSSDDKKEDGLVFTIEPGVYFPGKLGMRIEDTVGIENSKLTTFTNSSKDKVVISI